MSTNLMHIKWILMDVDGVLSDGRISYSSSGDEIKSFHAHDGQGIVLAHQAGLFTGIITGRHSPMVQRRAHELGIDFFMEGVNQKLPVYQSFLSQYGLKTEEVCYIGDDLPDLGLLKHVGFSVAVADARDEVKAICDYVTIANGGTGAVREVIDKILKGQKKLQNLVESYYSI